jgi:hypothetical protein
MARIATGVGEERFRNPLIGLLRATNRMHPKPPIRNTLISTPLKREPTASLFSVAVSSETLLAMTIQIAPEGMDMSASNESRAFSAPKSAMDRFRLI